MKKLYQVLIILDDYADSLSCTRPTAPWTRSSSECWRLRNQHKLDAVIEDLLPKDKLRRIYKQATRALAGLVGRKVDRRFYFSRLLPGTQRGRGGRRAACSYVLLRNSFSGKRGSFTRGHWRRPPQM